MDSTTALYLTAPLTFSIETHSLIPPPPQHLQIKLLATTLCGSDLHYYTSFRNGFIIPRNPMILGHEACGEVVALGDGVNSKEWAVGDLVALEVGRPCGQCEMCEKSRYNICPRMLFRSSAKWPIGNIEELGGDDGVREALEGTLQTGLNHPVNLCHKLPKDFSRPLACLLEPLAVALHASSRVPISKGSTALVLGAGPVGILVAHCLRKQGARTVLADINAMRLEYTKNNGFADETILIPTSTSPEETASFILEKQTVKKSGLPGFDAVFEATGVPSVINTAIHSAVPGGNVVVLGIPPASVSLDLAKATLREVGIVGSFRYAGEYPRAIEVAQEGGLDVVVTHTLKGLEEVERGFNIMKGKELAMKVCILME